MNYSIQLIPVTTTEKKLVYHGHGIIYSGVWLDDVIRLDIHERMPASAATVLMVKDITKEPKRVIFKSVFNDFAKVYEVK